MPGRRGGHDRTQTNRCIRTPETLSRGDRMQLETLRQLVVDTLEDMKARDIAVMDVRGKTAVTDYMIVASGTSDRHVKAIAETVAFRAKEAGEVPLGMEGVAEGEWALVDLNGVVVHVMLPKVRDYYNLERLWSAPAPVEKAAAASL
jgi:ribosome-associated protein